MSLAPTMDDLTVAQRERAERWAAGPKIYVNHVDSNFDPHHIFNVLGKIGRSVVVIENLSCGKYWEYPSYPKDIGDMLRRLSLGRYDGSKYVPSILHCFHVETRKLEHCLWLIGESLRMRGLRRQSQILFANLESGEWEAFTKDIEA